MNLKEINQVNHNELQPLFLSKLANKIQYTFLTKNYRSPDSNPCNGQGQCSPIPWK